MHEETEVSGPRGPGYRLREAREARGLSIGEAARNLRLDSKVIAALEDDDYAALPAPIFVKGYLNQYCKLLGLPADECVAEYERGVGGVQPPPLVVRRSAGAEIAPGSSPITLVSWLVAVIAVVMVVLWWVARPEPAPAPVERERVTGESPRMQVPVVGPAQRVPVETEPTETVVEEEAADEPVAVTPPPVVPEPETGLLQVRLEFREESWAEVVDANRRRLFFDLARAGAVIEVQGVAPISVFLGNAPAARITVDGRPFDHSRYVRSGNVARFTLGDDG